MPETGSEIIERTQQIIHAALRAGEYAVVGAALATPPIVGALHGLTSTKDITFAPGVSADINVARHPETNANLLGVGGGITLPAFHRHVPLIGDVAASIQANPAALPTKANAGLYASLFKDPKESIINPVEERITNDIEEDALESTFIELVILNGMVFMWRRQRKQEREDARELLDREGRIMELERSLNVLTNADCQTIANMLEPVRADLAAQRRDKQPQATNIWRRRLVGLSMLSIVAGAGLTQHDFVAADKQPAATASAQPLDPAIVKLDPKDLAGAKTYGTGANEILRRGVKYVHTYFAKVEDGQITIGSKITQAIDAEAAAGQLKYLNNQKFEAYDYVSDIHCNIYYLKYEFPAVLHATGARTVIDTGDTDVSQGKLPYENHCIEQMTEALQPTPAYPYRIRVIAILGNHDGPITAEQMANAELTDTNGQTYNPYTVLDAHNNYQTTDEGTIIAGTTDGRSSVFGEKIQPADPVAQAKILANEGHLMAQVTAKIWQETGQRPVLLTHDPSAAFASLNMGNVVLALSGHLHKQILPEAYLAANGEFEYRMVQGTSSGAGEDTITEISEPTIEAPTTILIKNKRTGQFVGYYNLIVHSDLSVSFSDFVDLTTSPVFDPTNMWKFLNTYDKNDLNAPTQPLAVPKVTPSPQHSHKPKIKSVHRHRAHAHHRR